jgi:hypothetical protein
MADDTGKHARRGPARVHIYGAGIAGLTAAHELARRGFRVRVYEPAQEYDEKGRPEVDRSRPRETHLGLAVGGMARSQYLRVARGALGNFPREGPFITCEESRLVYDYTRDYSPGESGRSLKLLPQEVTRFLHRHGLLSGGGSPSIIHIRIPKPVDNSRTPNRRTTAEMLRDYLTSESSTGNQVALEPSRVILVDALEEQFAQDVEAPYPELEDQDALLLELVHYLPGEHGFHFFASSYRHLFATMAETPILDEQGKPTGRRVRDNLVPSSLHGIAARGRRIRFASSGVTPSDTLQFTLRLWRYMCTSSGRRKDDFEHISWREYLEGYDPRTATRRYDYSEPFTRDLRFAPWMPVACDDTWGDARTHGNTLAQRYLDQLLPMHRTDGILNGPTTPAWLRPWRHYLAQQLRVEFVQGRLTQFKLQAGVLTAYVKTNRAGGDGPDTGSSPRGPTHKDEVDYYLVATDAVTAEEVTKDLESPIGVVQGLRGFTSRVPPNPRGREGQQERKAGVLPGHVPWDRFQTLTGIQFFFPSPFRLGEGCLSFLDTPWGLSAISSDQSWAAPPTLAWDGFASVLSVDIGNWHVREPGVKSPSECSRQEIAHEVWRQLHQATEQHHAPRSPTGPHSIVLPEPSWYSMDRNIRFEKDPDTDKEERPVENRAPYLVPIVGDWDNRPGPEPWDPWAPTDVPARKEPLPEGLWQAPHGGYPVHWGKLVFAGTYLKTFTRMTTMESANESARHAVNAIIDHYLAHPKPAKQPGQQGSLTGTPGFRMTPIGEYCRIWDPEKHELPELAALRELDAKLFAQGLPHVWDVLELEPQLLPLLPPLDAPGDAGPLREFLRDVCKRLETAL